MDASVLEQGPIELDRTIYPDDFVLAAVQAYRGFLELELLAEDTRKRTIQLRINPAYSSKAPYVRKEFLNYLLDLAVRRHLNLK